MEWKYYAPTVSGMEEVPWVTLPQYAPTLYGMVRDRMFMRTREHATRVAAGQVHGYGRAGLQKLALCEQSRRHASIVRWRNRCTGDVV